MKKTYLQPATLLTTVAAQRMVCASNEETVTVHGDDTVDDINSLQSRRGRSVWDDEYEEEEEGY